MQFFLHEVEKKYEKLRRRGVGGHVGAGDDRVHLHRGQGRVPEVLQQMAGETPRATDVGIRRRRVHNDLEAEDRMRLRVHI